MSPLDRLRSLGGARGFRQVPGALARHAFLAVRPWTPPVGRVAYAGLPTGERVRLLDGLAPAGWLPDGARSRPQYESGLVAGLRANVRAGDRVVSVGGGWGVTAALAATLAGPGGRVDVFEASDAMLPRVRATLAANGVSARVRVHHALVAANHGVYGGTTAATVSPADLPACDVLMLDCEGAERDILPTALADAPPRVALVETHGFCGAPTALVRGLLEAAGFRVVADDWAEADYLPMCRELDVRVLVALAPAAPVALA